ncbi:MAG: hypothetical protein DDT38_01158 [Firmicutes bacterium]|nr:hypothetical protein [candidate division NPL-UPA2 bacterium]
MSELKKMYNAACEAVQTAADAIEQAGASADMPTLRAALDTAVVEATRCQNNLEAAQVRTQFRLISGEAAKPTDPTVLGMSAKEVRSYSLLRAIRAAASGDWSQAGFEREASDEVAKRLNRSPRGFFVPTDAMAEKRDMVKGTSIHGGFLVETGVHSASFIDMLRNRMVVRRAGATVLSGLVGDVTIPRQTGGATAFWVAESGAPAETRQSVDQVALSPKTVGAWTDISRKLMLQSSIDAETFVRNDLATTVAIAIDFAALHGTGAANEPRGVASTAGIGVVVGGANGAVPTWAHVVGLETAVSIANADVGNLSYITNARVRGRMKQTQKLATTDSVMLWDANASPLNGYPVHVTQQVLSNLVRGSGTGLSAIFFGNWADLIIGYWGTLDILVDPYTGGTAGTVRAIVLQDVDVAIRRPASFSAMLDAITT